MIRPSLLLLFLLLPSFGPVSAQLVEVEARTPAEKARVPDDRSPQLLSKGFVDFQHSGQIQASAQMVKIFLGREGVFVAPLYLLTGATSRAFGEDEVNSGLVADLISHTGGLANLAIQPEKTLIASGDSIQQITIGGLLSGRLLAGREEGATEISTFGAGYVDAGIRAQTGAWMAGGSYSDGGVAWIQVRYASALVGGDELLKAFGEGAEQPAGVRFELGILIQDKVNVKLSSFRPTNAENLPGLDSSVWRFAFDYDVAN